MPLHLSRVPRLARVGVTLLGLCSLPAFATPQWHLSSTGSGLDDATAVTTVDVHTSGFVQVTPTSESTFLFNENGAAQLRSPTGTPPFGTNDITVLYSVVGLGNFLPGFVADMTSLNFVGGAIQLFSDSNLDYGSADGSYGAGNGTQFAAFEVSGGWMDFTFDGLRANVIASLLPGSLLPGYFFDEQGRDMVTAELVQLTLGLNFTVIPDPDAAHLSDVICGMGGYTGPGCDGTAFVPTPAAAAIRDGGYASVEAIFRVPEPATLLLLSAALVALATRRR